MKKITFLLNILLTFLFTNFSFSQASFTGGFAGVNKGFDGTTTASATGTSALSGVETGDDVSLGGSRAYTFTTANVGTGIRITTTGYRLSGGYSANYTLTQPSLQDLS